ncbi:MAG TPA: multidrug efflux RND transporter permease subunit [Deltaproteobacteria bacterium]|nr:multidrug efflux RND transporter permease subunit [Deltaproteobacteria bacterium]HOC76660.1 multidrug efflux RND transporter permease subunit [Deltaproteobacteria bacterium]HOY75058.1 multidrug efflux RND transporter permease subunit [Deltaproteobacteria bacterium]HPA74583.1 multidrug efflux RND transporter permease subunit [Deltaproteobacteria bacterium]HPO33135.1 multidrug efflux RND transporter permease subunit [Deltaproteobacteria bacterium]
MSRFFINRPIVAMVIAILMVIVGLVSMSGLPIAQFPNIVPPEIRITASYTGADALTVEQSVATPIEQQLSGVDNLNYMYSVNTNNGDCTITANFDIRTDANTDQVLTQMRQSQAESQLPADVRNYGVTVQKSLSAPLVVFALYSPGGTYDNVFLANYAYININDQMTRVKGIASVTVFGAGRYAMRLWIDPDRLAKLNITVPEVVNAVNAQNTVNPAGKIGAEPVPRGQDFTYAVRAQGRLESEGEFANIVIRANPDGSMVRLSDVARVELGAQTYSMMSRLNGKPSAVLAVYQMPGSNAIEAADGAKELMAQLKQHFPADLDYAVALDTTLAVTEGIHEIFVTLWIALALVIVVVFVFLQGWRATLIPLLAVPVSLVGTFMFFPLFGFSINTLSLFGLVLAIGLVVDDAIVVVEAVEHHIENGMKPRDATLKAMEEVSGPVVAIALILAAVFIPTAFIPGITGRLYQQFAVTIAVSVIISAFNALSLSPALASLLLRPKKEARGPLGRFFAWFNAVFGRATDRYVGVCGSLVRKTVLSLGLLAAMVVLAGLLGMRLPATFLPEEDQGYVYAAMQLPDAASLQRTDAAMKKAEDLILKTPGVEYCTAVAGYNLVSGVANTYSAFFFVTLKDWSERKRIEEWYRFIKGRITLELLGMSEALGMAFSPPAIPGIGTSGGITFILEDRAGKDIPFLTANVDRFLEAAKKRPEIANVTTTYKASVPQVFVDVDRDKVLTQGVNVSDVYKTLQCFMGGVFVNYFNRFGRQWQIFLQAEGEFRTSPDKLALFSVRNAQGDMVPLSALTSVRSIAGPEFTIRYNQYRSAQFNATAASGYTTLQAMAALEEVFSQTMPREMGYDYLGMSYQEKTAAEGVSPFVIFGFSLLCVFLILAAQYESWALPLAVLLGTPVAVMGAYGALWVLRQENNIYAQIGLVMLIGLAAKNAILIVEFAKMEYDKGRPVAEAALAGARLRLRPILMTSFAFILGCVPLAAAMGAGAIARRVMGIAVIGGMLAATGIAIFLIPVFFTVIQRLAHRHEGDRPSENKEVSPHA